MRYATVFVFVNLERFTRPIFYFKLPKKVLAGKPIWKTLLTRSRTRWIGNDNDDKIIIIIVIEGMWML